MRSRLTLLLISLTFVCSCTIEKRLYRPGFHVEWNKRIQPSVGETERVHVGMDNTIGPVRPTVITATDSLSSVADRAVQPLTVTTPAPQTEKLRLRNVRVGTRPLHEARQAKQALHKEETTRAKVKPKAVIVILTVVWFSVAALLVIGGIVSVSGSPALGILLLVLGGVMLVLPLLGIGGGRANKKKSAAGFAPRTAQLKARPEPRVRYRFRLRPDKDTQRKAVIIFVMIVLYILLAILGVAFGISLLTGGSVALGTILLVIGGLMLLIPSAVLILVALSGK